MTDERKLTTRQGHPVYDNQNLRTVGDRGPATLENYHFMEKLSHFDRERVPERVVQVLDRGRRPRQLRAVDHRRPAGGAEAGARRAGPGPRGAPDPPPDPAHGRLPAGRRALPALRAIGLDEVRSLQPLATQTLSEAELERLRNLGHNGPREVSGLEMTHCVPNEHAAVTGDAELVPGD